MLMVVLVEVAQLGQARPGLVDIEGWDADKACRAWPRPPPLPGRPPLQLSHYDRSLGKLTGDPGRDQTRLIHSHQPLSHGSQGAQTSSHWTADQGPASPHPQAGFI